MRLNLVDKLAFTIYRVLCALYSYILSLKSGNSIKDDIERMGTAMQSGMVPEDYPPEILEEILVQMRFVAIMVLIFLFAFIGKILSELVKLVTGG